MLRGRDKTKILLRKGKLVVGGFNHKSKDMICDVNFLNKEAIVNGQGIRHEEKLQLLNSWSEEQGLKLCQEIKEILPPKPEEISQAVLPEPEAPSESKTSIEITPSNQ